MDCSYGCFTSKIQQAAKNRIRECKNLQLYSQLQRFVQVPNPKLQSQIAEILKFAEQNFGSDALLISVSYFVKLNEQLKIQRLTIPAVIILASATIHDQNETAELISSRFGLNPALIWESIKQVLLELDHDLFVSLEEIEIIRDQLEDE